MRVEGQAHQLGVALRKLTVPEGSCLDRGLHLLVEKGGALRQRPRRISFIFHSGLVSAPVKYDERYAFFVLGYAYTSRNKTNPPNGGKRRKEVIMKKPLIAMSLTAGLIIIAGGCVTDPSDSPQTSTSATPRASAPRPIFPPKPVPPPPPPPAKVSVLRMPAYRTVMDDKSAVMGGLKFKSVLILPPAEIGRAHV